MLSGMPDYGKSARCNKLMLYSLQRPIRLSLCAHTNYAVEFWQILNTLNNLVIINIEYDIIVDIMLLLIYCYCCCIVDILLLLLHCYC